MSNTNDIGRKMTPFEFTGRCMACEEPGEFTTGHPGILAPRLATGEFEALGVERCDECQRYASDAEALTALLSAGHKVTSLGVNRKGWLTFVNETPDYRRRRLLKVLIGHAIDKGFVMFADGGPSSKIRKGLYWTCNGKPVDELCEAVGETEPQVAGWRRKDDNSGPWRAAQWTAKLDASGVFSLLAGACRGPHHLTTSLGRLSTTLHDARELNMLPGDWVLRLDADSPTLLVLSDEEFKQQFVSREPQP